MDTKRSHSPHAPARLRVGLIIILLISGKVVWDSVAWTYRRVDQGLGHELAEVIVAFLVILIFWLIVFGFRAAFGAKRVLQQHKGQAIRIYRSLAWCKPVCSLWNYIDPSIEMPNTPAPRTTGTVNTVDVAVILAHQPKRGRRPTYSIDRWIRVVAAWENQDPLRHPLTLAEFLAEEFGTYADGSPRMSENSFYDWRKKVIEEVRRRESLKNDGHLQLEN